MVFSTEPNKKKTLHGIPNIKIVVSESEMFACSEIWQERMLSLKTLQIIWISFVAAKKQNKKPSVTLLLAFTILVFNMQYFRGKTAGSQ